MEQAAEPQEPIGSRGTESDVGGVCPALLGHSPLVRRAAQQVRRAVAERGHVLVLAEPGLDAEGVARFVHSSSARGQEPCVLVDCTAGDPEDLDHLLFGSTEGRRGPAAEWESGACSFA